MKKIHLILGIIIILVVVNFCGCSEENNEDNTENQTEVQKLLGTWFDTSNSRQFTFQNDKTVVYKYYEHHVEIGGTGDGEYVAQPLLYYKWELKDSMLHITDSSSGKTGSTEFKEDRMKIYSPKTDSNLNCFKVDLVNPFPIEINEFSLTPDVIISGQNSELKWDVTNVTSFVIKDSLGNEIKSSTSLYYEDYSSEKSVTSSSSKSYILEVSNFQLDETREIELTVSEFTPEYSIDDNSNDIWQNKYVDDEWTYVSYEEDDRNYLDITDISHTLNGDKITLTMTFNEAVKSDIYVMYYMYIETEGKTYMAHYTNGVGSWSKTRDYETLDSGWLTSAISDNTFTASFTLDNPDYYYTIYGKAFELSGSGEMSQMEWWGDYAPDSYAPWDS